MDEFCAVSISEIQETHPEISEKEARQIQALIVMMTDMVFAKVASQNKQKEIEEK